ncbi:hypothetical protein JCM24511_08739 [Saitozyma sp. JCM 24511]|nr:hypothetical protein JCM24511_08739 [Saitozyma sp. JCM 24511]
MTTAATPRQLYRSYIQHLRLIPDPHLWSVLIPRFRSLLTYPKEPDSRGVTVNRSTASAGPFAGVQETQGNSSGYSSNHAESSAQAAYRELRRARRLKRAHKELRQLRAAVGCHPHAFSRLLEEAYGQRGPVRWELLNHIRITSHNPSATSEPPLTGRPPLPPPLLPLRPDPVLPQPVQRARRTLPPTAIRRAEKRAWTRETKLVKAPLVLPTPGERDVDLDNCERVWSGSGTGAVTVGTGWERRGVVRSLRILAGLEGRSEGTAGSEGSQPLVPRRSRGDSDSTTTTRNHEMPTNEDKLSRTSASSTLPPLPTLDHLPPHLRRIFPRNPVSRSTVPPPPPPPPPRSTRQNPRIWTPPRLLTTRLIQRLYHRLWKTLEWVRPAVRRSSALEGHLSTQSRSEQVGRVGRAETDNEEMQSGNEPIRWVKCSWEEMRMWERGEVVRDGGGKKKKKLDTAARPEEGRWSVASEEERMWLGGRGE